MAQSAQQETGTGQRTSTAQAERQNRPPRLRWHHLYYVLASFDLLAVALGLYLGQETLATYTHSVEINQRWTKQIEEVSDLNWLVNAVNRPGNDIFESKNVPAERAQLHAALDGFHDRLTALRQRMRETFAGSDLANLEALLDGVEALTDGMAVQVEQIFTDVSAGRMAEAGRHMAAVDRCHAEILGELSNLRTVVRGLQQESLSQQLAAAKRLQTVKYGLGACLLVMVLGAVAYGRRLAREAQREAVDREAAATAAQRLQRERQEILDAMPVQIVYKDRDNRIQWCNQSAADFVGLSVAQIVGASAEDLFPQRTAQFHAADPEVVRSGVPKLGIIHPAPSATGDRWMRTDELACRNEQGEIVGTIVCTTDITAAREADQRERLTTFALDHSTDGIVTMDATGRICTANRTFCLLHGYTAEEAVQLSVQDINPQSTADTWARHWDDLLRSGQDRFETVHRRKGGSLFAVEVSVGLLKVGDTRLSCSVIRDITERNQAEEAMKEQVRLSTMTAEVKSALVKDMALPAMLQACAEALVKSVDAAFARIWLLGPGDLCGSCHKAAHCADRDRCLHLTASAGLYTGLNGEYRRVPLGSLKIGRIAQGLGTMVTNDVMGDERLPNKAWMKEHGLQSFAGYPLHMESQLVGVLGLFARRPLSPSTVAALDNVSKAMALGIERKQAEASLRESEEQFRHVVEASPNGILVVDEGGHIVLANEQVERLFGYARLELVGQLVERLVPERYRGAHAGHRGGFFAVPRARPMGTGHDLYGLRKDGTEFPVEIGLSPTQTAAGRYVLAAIVDITARKQAEADLKERSSQLEAANKEMEAFSYSVSHDLQSPLRHINGFASLLQGREADRLDEKSRGYLQAISDSAVRMSRLIEALLNFSRLARIDVRKRLVPLEELIRSVREELQPETKGRTIVWAIGALPTIDADPTLLRQVWVNLMGNAIKYTARRDRATIEIGCASAAGDRETVVFIRDNGAGFDMKYAHKLFGVFERLHGADEFDGTGIGLANVQRIVARHGGRVWAEGAVGQGATFYVALPA